MQAKLVYVPLILMALASCEKTASPSAIVSSDLVPVGYTNESPALFKKKDTGVWDGNPSLGGVWVAYDDISKPLRVSIVNPKNNKRIVGNLFEKDVSVSGFQISSNAATALGIAPNTRSDLIVTAINPNITAKPTPAPVALMPWPLLGRRPARL